MSLAQCSNYSGTKSNVLLEDRCVSISPPWKKSLLRLWWKGLKTYYMAAVCTITGRLTRRFQPILGRWQDTTSWCIHH